MTTEKRTLVPLRDIIGLDFECPHCHTRCSFPLEKIDRLLYSCPNCHERWVREPKNQSGLEPDTTVLQALQRYLRESQRRDFDAVIRLEVKGEEETDREDLS